MLTPGRALAAAAVFMVVLWVGHQVDYARVAAQPVPDRARVVAGTVTRVYRTAGSGLFVKVRTDLGEDVAVMLSPALGSLDTLPQPGAPIKIVAGSTIGRSALVPVTKHHVDLGDARSREAFNQGAAPVRTGSIAEARRAPLGTKMLLQLRALSVRPFISRAGKRHLSLMLTDGQDTARGVMWEGTWQPDDLELMASGRPFVVQAKVGEFRGDLSLILRQPRSLD